MQITNKILERAGLTITRLMQAHVTKINEMFMNSDDGAKISLSLAIEPGPAIGSFRFEAGINFVTQRVKDTFTDTYETGQGDLFEGSGRAVKCPMRPVKGEDGETYFDELYASHCNNSCPERVLTIVVPGKEGVMPQALKPHETAAEGAFVQYRSCSAWADEDHKAWTESLVRKCEIALVKEQAQTKAAEEPKKKKKKKAA